MRISHILPLLATMVLTAMTTIALPVNAAVYTQAFDSPLGGLPADWSVAGYHNSDFGKATIATVGQITGLQQTRTVGTNGPTGNSWVYFQGNFGDITQGRLSDFTASALIRMTDAGSLDGERGFMVRASAPVGSSTTLSGYYISLTIGGQLNIYKDPGKDSSGAGSTGTLLQTASLPGGALSRNTDYLFSISAVGDTITGSIYGWSAADGSYSLFLGQVSTQDNTYSEGIFGFRTTFGGASRSVVWRDLTLTTIPEPGAAALLPLPLALWLAARARQKSRSVTP